MLEKNLAEKISKACDAYHQDAKSRGRNGFNFELWLGYANILNLLDEQLRENNQLKSSERDAYLKALTGTARSTARRHLQIFRVLDRINSPESTSSWRELYERSTGLTL